MSKIQILIEFDTESGKYNLTGPVNEQPAIVIELLAKGITVLTGVVQKKLVASGQAPEPSRIITVTGNPISEAAAVRAAARSIKLD